MRQSPTSHAGCLLHKRLEVFPSFHLGLLKGRCCQPRQQRVEVDEHHPHNELVNVMRRTWHQLQLGSIAGWCCSTVKIIRQRGRWWAKQWCLQGRRQHPLYQLQMWSLPESLPRQGKADQQSANQLGMGTDPLQCLRRLHSQWMGFGLLWRVMSVIFGGYPIL